MNKSFQYQRMLSLNGQNITLTTSSDPALIFIQSSFGVGRDAVVIATLGEHGADLVSAFLNINTAVQQGVPMGSNVDGLAIEAVICANNHVRFRRNNPPALFSVTPELMDAMTEQLQILLNDSTGEYRRQVAEVERNIQWG